MTRIPRLLAVGAAIVVAAGLALPPLLGHFAGQRLRREAAARKLTPSWNRLSVGWDGRLTLDHLILARREAGDTLFAAESLAVTIDRWALLALRTRVAEIGVAHATIQLPGRRAADPDTLAPESEPEHRDRRVDPVRAERIRRSAEALVRAMLTPVRRLPGLSLRDVTLQAPPGAEALGGGVRFAWLETRPEAGGIQLAAVGAFFGERELPFEASFRHAGDDRFHGGLRVTFPDGGSGRPADMLLTLDGAIAQDRRHGVVVVSDSTRVTIGKIPLRLGARVERQGPRFQLDLDARGITAERMRASLPPAVLGPLLDLDVEGSFDYRLDLDLDLAEPDSVRFTADVIPNDLAIDPTRTRLPLLALEEPFIAQVHLPRGRVVERELSFANPYFRPLPAIAPALVAAVVTNEDGGFFRHRGFNLDAVKAAIAENLKAGAFRRGAGTITMQLARNLYLGHDRTLSRKFREVVLAWVIEHLTRVSKERLLEIYFNIIEWGPGVHGAAEAARWYFDRDPAELTVDEALFLATVVPSPAKWRYRLDAAGELRPFERAQMHFIGRAMIAKGWLAPEALPPPDSLRVELRGLARAVLFPDSLGSAESGLAPADLKAVMDPAAPSE